jgi:hypothetical protein
MKSEGMFLVIFSRFFISIIVEGIFFLICKLELIFA